MRVSHGRAVLPRTTLDPESPLISCSLSQRAVLPRTAISTFVYYMTPVCRPALHPSVSLESALSKNVSCKADCNRITKSRIRFSVLELSITSFLYRYPQNFHLCTNITHYDTVNLSGMSITFRHVPHGCSAPPA
jgi:hypothetical protein